MKFVLLNFILLFFYGEVHSFFIETSFIDTSSSLNEFEVLRKICGGSPEVNYSNGVASYDNIKNFRTFRYSKRVFLNPRFIGGWDLNYFNMFNKDIEYSRDPFTGKSYKFYSDNNPIHIPKFIFRYEEGGFDAMTAALLFQRPITDKSYFKIDITGKMNSPGENSFWYSYRNSEDEFGDDRIYYTNDNRRVGINMDLGIRDFRDNQLTLMFDRELNFYDDFVWRNHSSENLRYTDSLFSYLDTLGYYKYRTEATSFQDTASLTDYMGFDYGIIEGSFNLNINSGQSNRISHLGYSILNNHISLISDYNFGTLVIKNDFGFIYEKTASKNLEKVYHSKIRTGKFGIDKWILDNVLFNINYGILDYDYSFSIHQSFSTRADYFFDIIDASVFAGLSTNKELRDHTLTNDLDIRLPLAANPNLKQERIGKLYIGAKSSDIINVKADFSKIENKIYPINRLIITDNMWKFENIEQDIYRFGLNLRFKYDLPFMFTAYANIYYNSYDFVFNEGYNALSSIGEHNYINNISLNRRFSWLDNRLLGNLKGEYEILSPVYKINLSDINYSFEESKNIFNLYSNVIMNNFVMYYNVKNLTNEIIHNDYGVLVEPLTFQWGIRWYLYN